MIRDQSHFVVISYVFILCILHIFNKSASLGIPVWFGLASFLYWLLTSTDDADILADWNSLVTLKVLIGIVSFFFNVKILETALTASLTLNTESAVDVCKYIFSILEKNKIVQNRKIWMANINSHDLGVRWANKSILTFSTVESRESLQVTFFFLAGHW